MSTIIIRSIKLIHLDSHVKSYIITVMSIVSAFLVGYMLGIFSVKAKIEKFAGRPPLIFSGTEFEQHADTLILIPVHTVIPKNEKERLEMLKVFKAKTGKNLIEEDIVSFGSFGNDDNMVGLEWYTIENSMTVDSKKQSSVDAIKRKKK